MQAETCLGKCRSNLARTALKAARRSRLPSQRARQSGILEGRLHRAAEVDVSEDQTTAVRVAVGAGGISRSVLPAEQPSEAGASRLGAEELPRIERGRGVRRSLQQRPPRRVLRVRGDDDPAGLLAAHVFERVRHQSHGRKSPGASQPPSITRP